MTNKLDRNVGTQGHPISWLHERAVALLWDELRRGLFENRRNPNGSRQPPTLRREPLSLRVRTDRGWSGDLCAGGVARIDFPDDLTHIGGVIPDIAIYNEAGRPIRLIEVVVTSAPDHTKQSKLEALEARGIEVVIVPVKDENDLLEMCWDHDQYAQDRPRISQIKRQREEDGSPHRYLPEAENFAEQLVEALTSCSPRAKLAVLDALRDLQRSGVEDLFPLSRGNPKRERL